MHSSLHYVGGAEQTEVHVSAVTFRSVVENAATVSWFFNNSADTTIGEFSYIFTFSITFSLGLLSLPWMVTSCFTYTIV